MMLYADRVGAVNCLEPHPFLPAIATSGLAHSAKIWRPLHQGSLSQDMIRGKGGVTVKEVMEDNSDRSSRRGGGMLEIPDSMTPEELLRLLGFPPLVVASAVREHGDPEEGGEQGQGQGQGQEQQQQQQQHVGGEEEEEGQEVSPVRLQRVSVLLRSILRMQRQALAQADGEEQEGEGGEGGGGGEEDDSS
ncbi:unnamed protein product, partial [Discosporangium mesarthrocarpum]